MESSSTSSEGGGVSSVSNLTSKETVVDRDEESGVKETNILLEKPSLKSIATNSKTKVREGAKVDGESEDEDVSLNGTSASLQANLKENRGRGKFNVEHNLRNVEKGAKNRHDFQREFFKVLKAYFKSAFTIIIRNRRLCPSDGFQSVRVLGTKVPRFLHPCSLEYVDEVSKRLVLFVNRNIAEGCVLHVMIEKNKTMHVVQRFVFKIFGNIDLQNIYNDEVENVYDLEELKSQCKSSLLEILNCDEIKPMAAPQFSRWSLSIGVIPEFVEGNEDAFQQLWKYDPSAGFFPWKKRPKGLASYGRRVSCKLDFANEPLTKKPRLESCDAGEELPFCDIDKTFEKPTGLCDNQKGESDGFNNDTVQNANSKNNLEDCNDTNINNGDTQVKLTSEIVDVDFDEIICFPVSTFQIFPGLVMSLYGLEYPAPQQGNSSNTQTPATSVRNFRSPKSYSHRLSQLRSRLSKMTSRT